MTSIDSLKYQMLVVKHGLTIYARSGVRVNTAYTPKRMMQTAERLTGKTFKARDYLGAAQALADKLEELA